MLEWFSVQRAPSFNLFRRQLEHFIRRLSKTCQTALVVVLYLTTLCKTCVFRHGDVVFGDKLWLVWIREPRIAVGVTLELFVVFVVPIRYRNFLWYCRELNLLIRACHGPTIVRVQLFFGKVRRHIVNTEQACTNRTCRCALSQWVSMRINDVPVVRDCRRLFELTSGALTFS